MPSLSWRYTTPGGPEYHIHPVPARRNRTGTVITIVGIKTRSRIVRFGVTVGIAQNSLSCVFPLSGERRQAIQWVGEIR